MLALTNPSEAYRRVDFDARVKGADPKELVTLCYEQFISALGSAIFAHDRGDNRLKSQALTRALAAVTVLKLGINQNEGIASALFRFYEGTRRALLDNVLTFDPERVASIRQDFIEVVGAMTRAS